MGNQARAIEVLTEASEKNPRPFHALADIADLYFERHDYDEAMKWARKSLKVNRRFLFPIATLIAINIIRGDYEAIARLIKTVDVGRRQSLKMDVESRLKSVGQKAYKKKLDASFIAAGKQAGSNQQQDKRPRRR